MDLSSRDLKGVLKIADLIHTCADKQALINTVFQEVDRLIGICSAVYLPIDPVTQNFQFPGPIHYNLPDETAVSWVNYYHRLDPMVTGWQGDINKAMQNTEILPAPRLAASEFNVDFLAKLPIFYVMGGYMGTQGDPVAVLGLHRQKTARPFSEREKQLVDLVFPRLSHALHRLQLHETLSSLQNIGVIAVGPDGKVISMNPVARRALDGKPAADIPAPRHREGPTLFQSGAGVFRVRTTPNDCGRGLLIFLEPLPREEDFRRKLAQCGLSPREQEVAVLVIRGYANREIAERLFICEQTVKDHLRHIYEKTKVHRRCELVAKVIGLKV